jgi:hypothetical protein
VNFGAALCWADSAYSACAGSQTAFDAVEAAGKNGGGIEAMYTAFMAGCPKHDFSNCPVNSGAAMCWADSAYQLCRAVGGNPQDAYDIVEAAKSGGALAMYNVFLKNPCQTTVDGIVDSR